MLDKLPLAMIPSYFFFSESFPVTSTGKVDYAQLACMASSIKPDPDEFDKIQSTELLQVIKKAFCDALMVEMVPMKLQMALMGKEGLRNINGKTDANLAHEESLLSNLKSPSLHNFRPRGRILRLCDKSDDFSGKRQKVNSDYYRSSIRISLGDGYPWDCNPFQVPCSFSRCNKIIYEGSQEGKDLCQKFIEVEIPRNKKIDMKEVWKVHMESCIDASPLVVFKDQDVFVFIGSHSFKFLCINAKSGFVQWETKLEGRIECSAAIIGDFSQVVVGCYQGIIYFIDLLSGSICWHFQTCGEVKCQPVVDECRNLVWCGSHDCNLYALDYRSYCCVYKISCGGSIYGSPVIDEVSNTLYVASTSGRVTAISIKAMPFSELWLRELEAPVFGSLSIYSQNGNVLCCLVDGQLLHWMQVVPLFGRGGLLWEHNLGDPITSSAYVDENLQLVSNFSHLSDRLDLQGNIFSSPVMIGGRIFVGCRDDYMHCLQLKSEEVNGL
ncbi:hypothetical protein C3L33_05069, partial [Rhododendron williamsianum]